MFGLGILKGTIIGLGIGVIASYALKEACKNSNKNKYGFRISLETTLFLDSGLLKESYD